jgi:hypothetical protein
MGTKQESFALSVRAAARAARAVGPRAEGFFGARLRNPVFMVGCGRSGTSLLATLLSSHPDIAVFPSEANDLWHPGTHPWYRSKGRVRPIWVDPDRFTKHSLARIEWSKIRAIFGAFQSITGRPVFLNKSVMVTFMLKDISFHFKEARFIHMYRDGRAVALSYAKKTLPKIQHNPDLYASVGVTDDFQALVYQNFDHWMQHIDAVESADRDLGLSNSGRLLEFSYEAFSRKPHEHITAVLDFLGLEDRGADLAVDMAIDNRNYKMSDELRPEILEGLVIRGARTLGRMGYTAKN